MADSSLRLFFSGLCGFVPKEKLDSKVGPSSLQTISAMRVLLPDARGYHHHEHHAPVLKIEQASVDESGSFRKPDRIFEIGGTPWAFFDLADQDVEIKDAAGGVKVMVGSMTAGDEKKCPVKDQDVLSFDWVAPVAKVIDGSGVVRKECFLPGGDLKNPVHASVVARIRLTGGILRNSRFARETKEGDDRNKILRWQFAKPDGGDPLPLEQALAEETELCYGPVDKQIELTTTFLRDGDSSQRTIGLKAGVVVEAYLLNMPWLDILRTRETYVLARPADFHFEHFYPMLESTPAKIRIPHPGPRFYCDPVEDPPLSPSNPQCPPAQFTENSGA